MLFSASATVVASGDDGYAGNSGSNGQDGANGQNGLAGANGLAGIGGATGQAGAPGGDGFAGADGFSGVNGSDGALGLPGLNGSNGAAGFAGASGGDGALGLAGLNGGDGAAGANGADGFAGADGANGALGLAGLNGGDGAAGANGAVGADGANGSDGALGFAGLDGSQGSDGQSGANGQSGVNGSSGRDGADGRDGRDGAPTRIPVSTAYATTLIASEDTCMGSTSLGGQGITVGVSVASTWQDANCRRLKNARQLDALGYRRAAVALLCVDDEVREAMRVAGTPCPGEPQPIVEVVAEPPPQPQPEPQHFSVHFDFDSAALKPEAEPALQGMLNALHEDRTLGVEIDGHADSVGPDSYNVALSQRRARAVVDWLAAHGAAPEQLVLEAKGESEPIASNATPAGRALNRRVEVTLRPRLMARS